MFLIYAAVDEFRRLKKAGNVGKRFAPHFTCKNLVIILGKKKPVYVNWFFALILSKGVLIR